ncbi:NUDIX hydrolase [Streptomyces fructofermentans]|uniref:NUDIX hydrolase n=1 Tax=Streptomyces fructofermentans TaxID=152141 RepID=UPI001E2901A5|nr:NUDIX hydrolase [Streptomyces fructofermentans]
MSTPRELPLAVDDRGNALISVEYGPEGSPPSDAPLRAALVALWDADRVLLVFDRYRQSWELPGGTVEPGETHREGAVRELFEESGQVPDGQLRFVGYPRYALAPDGRPMYAALFAGRASAVREFRATEEIGAIHWWDFREPLPGGVKSVDVHVARLTRDATP